MFAAWLAIFSRIDLAKIETHLRYPVHGSGQWQVVASRLASGWDQDQFSLLLLFIHAVKTNFGVLGWCIKCALLAATAENQHRSKEASANNKPRDTRSDHFVSQYLISRTLVIVVD